MNDRTRRLLDIYASLPTIDCQGKCYDSCGPTGMGGIEAARVVAARGGRPIGHVQPAGVICPLLTKDNRCSVYKVRPLLCRLWGIVENLPCVYGCKPEPRYLTTVEGYELMREVVEDLSGGVSYETAPRDIIQFLARQHHIGGWR
jgi:Fe-S-cluster containining protein